MKLIYLTGILLSLVSMSLNGQIVATTDEGKQVQLNPNGTWSYKTTDDNANQESINNVQVESDANQNSRNSTENPVIKNTTNVEKTMETNKTNTDPTLLQKMLKPEYLIVTGVFIVLIGIILLYFLVLMPHKKKKQIVKAFNLLQSESIDKAIQVLEKCIMKGLKEKLANEALFALAYAKLKLNKLDEALSEINKITAKEVDSIYLKLYINYKKKAYKEIEEIYNEHTAILENYKQSKEILSIACLELGKEKFDKKLHREAIPYFEKVKELEIFAHLVPENISNLEITLGIQALYNQEHESAEEYFTSAKDKAIQEKRSTIEAELGLLLCFWLNNEGADIEEQMNHIVSMTETDYIDTKPFEKEDLDDETINISEKHILISNIYLLYSISYIYTWFHLPENKGLPNKYIIEINDRLNKALAFNPMQKDSDFMTALIDYFFNEDADKADIIDKLEKSGSNLPDIVRLMKQEKESLEKEKRVVERYIELAASYIHNEQVPAELRKELKERLNQYDRFKNTIESDDSTTNENSETATVTEIQARSRLTRKHIDDILKKKYANMTEENKSQFDTLINEINDSSKKINYSTKKLEKTEHLLMLNSGEYILQEDVIIEEDSDQIDNVENEKN